MDTYSSLEPQTNDSRGIPRVGSARRVGVSLTACAEPVSGRRLAKADVRVRVGRRGWWAGSKKRSTRWGVLVEPRGATMRTERVHEATERRAHTRETAPRESLFSKRTWRTLRWPMVTE